jgi:hypothetical protein
MNLSNEYSEEPLRPPKPPEERRLNKQTKESVVFLVDRYRVQKCMFPHEELSDAQIDDILLGVRDVIYKYEGRRPPKL